MYLYQSNLGFFLLTIVWLSETLLREGTNRGSSPCSKETFTWSPKPPPPLAFASSCVHVRLAAFFLSRSLSPYLHHRFADYYSLSFVIFYYVSNMRHRSIRTLDCVLLSESSKEGPLVKATKKSESRKWEKETPRERFNRDRSTKWLQRTCGINTYPETEFLNTKCALPI